MADTDFLLAAFEQMLDAKLDAKLGAFRAEMRDEMRDMRRELKADIRGSEQRLAARMDAQDIRLKDTEERLTDYIDGRVNVVLASMAEGQAQRAGSIRELQSTTNRHEADLSDIKYRLARIEAKLKE